MNGDVNDTAGRAFERVMSGLTLGAVVVAVALALFSCGGKKSGTLEIDPPAFWEEVDHYTRRAKVHGGWVVKSISGSGLALCFIPDPNHEWVVK